MGAATRLALANYKQTLNENNNFAVNLYSVVLLLKVKILSGIIRIFIIFTAKHQSLMDGTKIFSILQKK